MDMDPSMRLIESFLAHVAPRVSSLAFSTSALLDRHLVLSRNMDCGVLNRLIPLHMESTDAHKY